MRPGVIFDTYDKTGLSNMGENFRSGPLFQSFLTSAATTSLQYAICFFLGQPGQTLNTIAAALLADASGHPGTVLANLGNLDQNPQAFTFSSTAGGVSTSVNFNVTASPLTRYWLRLTDSSPTAASWATTRTPGLLSASEFWGDSAGISSATSGHGPFQMLVFDQLHINSGLLAN